jgi:hypothetical protein
MTKRFVAAFAAATAVFGVCFGGNLARASRVSGALAAAHEAYLADDDLALGERIREVLIDPGSSESEKANAFELLDKAYQVRGGRLPSNFKLPHGFGEFQFACRRFISPNRTPFYQLRFAGRAHDVSHVKGVTVTRLPNEVLMDEATGKGSFGIRRDPDDTSRGLEAFYIDSERMDAPLQDGVVSLRVELDDGTVSEGFVIVRDLVPDTTPEILSPAPDETLSDANPTVRWSIPRSTSASTTGLSRRNMNMWVARLSDGSAVWAFGSNNPDLNEVRIGSSAGKPTTALMPGDYWLGLDAVEGRMFGPVEVLSSTRVSQLMHIIP